MKAYDTLSGMPVIDMGKWREIVMLGREVQKVGIDMALLDELEPLLDYIDYRDAECADAKAEGFRLGEQLHRALRELKTAANATYACHGCAADICPTDGHSGQCWHREPWRVPGEGA